MMTQKILEVLQREGVRDPDMVAGEIIGLMLQSLSIMIKDGTIWLSEMNIKFDQKRAGRA
jgi:hypothetical protein